MPSPIWTHRDPDASPADVAKLFAEHHYGEPCTISRMVRFGKHCGPVAAIFGLEGSETSYGLTCDDGLWSVVIAKHINELTESDWQ